MLARMETSEAALLGREWTALHRDCEASERSALWIKLGAVALTAMAVALSFDAVLTIVLVGVLWVQEAIVRTGQSRLVDRLLYVEGLLRDPMASPRAVCQLYSDCWRSTSRLRRGPRWRFRMPCWSLCCWRCLPSGEAPAAAPPRCRRRSIMR
jgi:hypothetical protein